MLSSNVAPQRGIKNSVNRPRSRTRVDVGVLGRPRETGLYRANGPTLPLTLNSPTSAPPKPLAPRGATRRESFQTAFEALRFPAARDCCVRAVRKFPSPAEGHIRAIAAAA